nr:hypothetical protein [Allochromatium tepidum]
MSTLKAFSDKDRAYHAYQARQNYLREQRSIQRHLDELKAEAEHARAEKEQARVLEEQARVREEQARMREQTRRTRAGRQRSRPGRNCTPKSPTARPGSHRFDARLTAQSASPCAIRSALTE